MKTEVSIHLGKSEAVKFHFQFTKLVMAEGSKALVKITKLQLKIR